MLKKSMDIVDIYTWTQLNKGLLRDCFIDNVYRLDYSWLLKLRCLGEVKLLKIWPGQSIYFTMSEPLSKSIDNFAKFLRAHIRDGKILNVEVPWWERVIAIKIAKGGKEQIHYVEIVPRGLWVITDNSNKILYASHFEEFRDRVIKPGISYSPPPPRGIAPWDPSILLDVLLRSKDIVRGIVTGWGLPGYLAEEILFRIGLYNDKLKKPIDLPRIELERLAIEYKNIVEESLKGRGFLVLNEYKIEFYSPYKPLLFIELFNKDVREDEFNRVVDVYFNELEAVIKSEEKRKEVEKQIESWNRRLEEHKKIVEKYSLELNEIRDLLSFIYNNYTHILQVLNCSKTMKKEYGWEAVYKCGVKKYMEKQGLILVEIGNREIALSIRESLESQVLKLEKKRGELEKKIEKALEVLKELEAKTSVLERELTYRVHVKTSPKYWYEKYRWSITRNGYIVIAGRDSSQNETIVRKYLGEKNIFLHADIHGAPATILIKNGREPSEDDLFDAATIAACYSKAWKEGFAYVDVYWVHGNQVSKTPPSGEYLSKGAFMIYGERNYLRIALKLGIGLRIFCDQVYGDYVKIYIGSPEIVKKTSISYVIIIPGEEDRIMASKEITKILREKALEKTNIKFDITEDEVLRAIPGPVRIVEYGIGNGIVSCES